MIFDDYFVYSNEPFKLRPEFVESVAPGTLFVSSVVPEIVTAYGAKVYGAVALVETEAGCYCRVRVSGVHKHLPDWDMREVNDSTAAHSRAFFNQEWN